MAAINQNNQEQSMNIVFVVNRCDWEGDQVMGIYMSEQQAQQVADELRAMELVKWKGDKEMVGQFRVESFVIGETKML